MAQQFETQAIIRLIDEVTGPLRKLSGTISDYNAAAARAHRAAQEDQVRMSTWAAETSARMWDAAKIKTLEVANHTRDQMFQIGMSMDVAQNEMRMFTKATEGDIGRLKDVAQTKGAWAAGGPAAFMAAEVEAIKAGVLPEFADVAAQYGAIYARLAHQAPEHAMRELIQHMMMMGELKKAGTELAVTTQAATQADWDYSLERTLGRMAGLTKNVTGWKMDDAFNFFKNFGPAANAQHIPWADAAAFAATLSQKGFSGEVAGNAMASAFGQFTSPKGPARQALASANMDWAKYATINPAVLSGEGFGKGVVERIGTIPKSTQAAANKIIDQYHEAMKVAAGDPSKQADLTTQLRTKLTDTLIAIGDKRLGDRAKAGNFVKTFLSNAVNSVDMIQMMVDAKERGLGIGFYNAIFGRDRGKQIMAISADEWKEQQRKFQKIEEAAPETTKHIKDTYDSSYEGRVAAMEGKIQGMYNSLFEPLKPILSEAATWVGNAAEGIQHMTTASRGLAGAAALAAGAVAGWWALMRVADFSKAMAAVAGGTAVSTAANVATGGAATAGAAAAAKAEAGIAARVVSNVVVPVVAAVKLGEGVASAAERVEKEQGLKPADNPNAVVKDMVADNIADFGVWMASMFGVKPKDAADNMAKKPEDRQGWDAPILHDLDRQWKHGRPWYDEPPSMFSIPQFSASDYPLPGALPLPAPAPAKTEVKGDVSGEVQLHQTMEIRLSPLLEAKLNKIDSITVPLAGKLGETAVGPSAARASRRDE